MLTIALLLAVLGLVQDQPTTAIGLLAFAALQPVLGWVGGKLYDGIKTIFPFYDRLSATWHQILAPLFTFVFGFIANATGAAFLTDLHAISGGWIGGIFVTLLAAGIKRWEKSKQPVDATAVLESTRLGSQFAHSTRRPPSGPHT